MLYVTISVSGPLCGLSPKSIAYPFVYNNVRYLSVIQAYYASFVEDKRAIQKATTVALIEKTCASVSRIYGVIQMHKRRSSYLETKRILYNILRAKFEQNPIAKILLLATRSDWYLQIDCGSDVVIGSSGFGLNLSGLIMMELREHLAGRPRTPLLQQCYDMVLRRMR